MYYTLIAYKADSEDVCRGCSMDRFSSDFEIYTNISKDRLVDHIVRLETQELSQGEDDWEIFILFPSNVDPEEPFVELEWPQILYASQLNEALSEIHTEAVEKIAAVEAARKKTTEEAVQAKQKKRKEDEETTARATYKQLKERFE
ncbi:hypothetical protein LCGC14_0146330 [marine sediment metagenome]|uniref:Uncharacterized protein n=1 Tax=marine sediment metagenome TaxID=412755 RepID=A0A0F9VFF2_9ZZZZ